LVFVHFQFFLFWSPQKKKGTLFYICQACTACPICKAKGAKKTTQLKLALGFWNFNQKLGRMLVLLTLALTATFIEDNDAEAANDEFSFQQINRWGPPKITMCRESHEMTALTNNHVLLFGGVGMGYPSGADFMNDTYIYTWDCKNSGGWEQLFLPKNPCGRSLHAMANLDIEQGRVLLFGGRNAGPDQKCLTKSWIFVRGDNDSTTSWIELPFASPPVRERLAMTDLADNRALLFGGHTTTTNYVFFNDTWIFQEESGWKQLNIPGPAARANHALAVANEARTLAVLYGGDYFEKDGWEQDLWKKYTDTWLFNLTSMSWKLLTVSNSPPSVTDHGMAGILPRSSVVFFGGIFAGAVFMSQETWLFDLTTQTWTNMTLNSKNPVGRWHSGMARVCENAAITFGGFDGEQLLDDTYIFHSSTDEWTNGTFSPFPPARLRPAMASSQNFGASMLFGGYSSLDSAPLADTWVFYHNNKSNSLATAYPNEWVPIPTAHSPSPRYGHTMESVADLFVMLFGGTDGNIHLNDTWSWDAQTADWIDVSKFSFERPLARSVHAMTRLGKSEV
jgi:hypothetical protein